MRYPTMSGLKIDAAGVSSAAEEVKSVPVANMPKPALKPPSAPPQATVEYGSKPPALPKSVGFKEPVTYNDKLEAAFPASHNDRDPANR